MATIENSIPSFATSSAANVMTDAELAIAAEIQNGFEYGSIADSRLIGKLIKNNSAVANQVANLIKQIYTTMIANGGMTDQNYTISADQLINNPQMLFLAIEMLINSSAIPKTGDRSMYTQLAGYNTCKSISSNTYAVTADSEDDIIFTGSKINVVNGASGLSWTKVISLPNDITVELDSNWVWNSDYTLGRGLLVLHWHGDFGTATFNEYNPS